MKINHNIFLIRVLLQIDDGLALIINTLNKNEYATYWPIILKTI
jgi:hypothetical protein